MTSITHAALSAALLVCFAALLAPPGASVCAQNAFLVAKAKALHASANQAAVDLKAAQEDAAKQAAEVAAATQTLSDLQGPDLALNDRISIISDMNNSVADAQYDLDIANNILVLRIADLAAFQADPSTHPQIPEARKAVNDATRSARMTSMLLEEWGLVVQEAADAERDAERAVRANPTSLMAQAALVEAQYYRQSVEEVLPDIVFSAARAHTSGQLNVSAVANTADVTVAEASSPSAPREGFALSFLGQWRKENAAEIGYRVAEPASARFRGGAAGGAAQDGGSDVSEAAGVEIKELDAFAVVQQRTTLPLSTNKHSAIRSLSCPLLYLVLPPPFPPSPLPPSPAHLVGSHQFKVTPGDAIYVEKLNFAHVNDVKAFTIAAVEGAAVEGAALHDATVHDEAALDAKVIVFKKKRRKNYRRTNGHRQWTPRVSPCLVAGLPIEELDAHLNFRRGWTLGFVDDVEDKTQILPFLRANMDPSLHRRKRRVLVDLGANEFETSVTWFLRMYPLDFTEIHAVEVQTDLFQKPSTPPLEVPAYEINSQSRLRPFGRGPAGFPAWLMDRVHPYNFFISSQDNQEENATNRDQLKELLGYPNTMNVTRWLLDELQLTEEDTVMVKMDIEGAEWASMVNVTRWLLDELQLTEDDTVIVKMDIEGAEWAVLHEWLAIPHMPAIVDELFVEVHYHHPSMHAFTWTPDKFNRTLDETTRLLTDLRRAGFYVHPWP
ncbi:unnamed protein product [Closterium sp. NIES-65]|nr:unnamed protein product [Closterium sp. NIES-65]